MVSIQELSSNGLNLGYVYYWPIYLSGLLRMMMDAKRFDLG